MTKDRDAPSEIEASRSRARLSSVFSVHHAVGARFGSAFACACRRATHHFRCRRWFGLRFAGAQGYEELIWELDGKGTRTARREALPARTERSAALAGPAALTAVARSA